MKRNLDTEHALGLHGLMFGRTEDSAVYDSVTVTVDKPMTWAELENAIAKAASAKELQALSVRIPRRGQASGEICARLWRRHWSRTLELDAIAMGVKVKGVTGEER